LVVNFATASQSEFSQPSRFCQEKTLKPFWHPHVPNFKQLRQTVIQVWTVFTFWLQQRILTLTTNNFCQPVMVVEAAVTAVPNMAEVAAGEKCELFLVADRI
jgi:hypothetical protein